MSYKANASADRDALFGQPNVSTKKKLGKGSRDKTGGSGGRPDSKTKQTASTRPSDPVPSSKGYKYGGNKKKAPLKIGLSGDAKDEKMKEAEEYRDKAKKAMQKGLFSNPDPLAASTYYKRAADAYQLCGETRLERLFRINSADCQAKIGAWATAAAEYARAAELLQISDDDTHEMKREIGRRLHLNAADAWRNMNEPGKAAASKVQAAFCLMWGDDSSMLPKIALEAIEEAVESHVPDPMNPYSRYRQTGVSAYIDPNSEDTAESPPPEALELAKQHIITRPYAHESVQEIMHFLISYGEYASALYAAGGVTALLSQNGVSTLTLSRAFVAETIITLAMGDSVAAEENFLVRHVQQSSYLSSRECKLAEDLFRAIKMRDGEALEEAREVKGSNRAALGNLHESLRELVRMIRLSGVARKGPMETCESEKEPKKKDHTKKSKGEPPMPQQPIAELLSRKTGYEEDMDDAEGMDETVLQDELDALDFGDDESDLDDDGIDLR